MMGWSTYLQRDAFQAHEIPRHGNDTMRPAAQRRTEHVDRHFHQFSIRRLGRFSSSRFKFKREQKHVSRRPSLQGSFREAEIQNLGQRQIAAERGNAAG